MKTKPTAGGFAKDTDIIPKLEGMEVEFDEKVTLFPVELEEMRDVAPKRRSDGASSKSMH
jgi:hypothetical protein